MKQRVITGILFTLGVLLFVIPSLWWPLIIVLFACLVGGVAMYELHRALYIGGMRPNLPLIITGGAVSPIIAVTCYFMQQSLTEALALYLVITGMLCLASCVMPSIIHKEGEGHLKDGVVTAAVIFYCTFPLFCLMAGMLLVEKGDISLLKSFLDLDVLSKVSATSLLDQCNASGQSSMAAYLMEYKEKHTKVRTTSRFSL